MNLIVFSLLIGLSMVIGKTKAFLSEDELEAMVEDQMPLFSDSNGRSLILEVGNLSQNDQTIVWRATYGNEKVAVKMIRRKSNFDQELKIYQKLNAVKNPAIEKKGIPNVLCHGSFLSWTMENIYFIAMTLFEGNLESRFWIQKRTRKNISDLSLSLIFKRSVEVLQYIHSQNVIHNDIKPANIFLRGSEVFIGDFDLATFKGVFTSRSTPKFASLNLHKSHQRTEVDDFQSLIFSIWDVAGVVCNPRQTYGSVLLDSIKNGKLELEVQKNCQHFKHEHIQKTFESICDGLFKNQDPDYITINKTLTTATKKLSGETGQTQFEWLPAASSSQSS